MKRADLEYLDPVSRDNEHGCFVDFGIMPQENNKTAIDEFSQGLALQQQKKWDESLQSYQKALDLGLNNLAENQASVVYFNMAVVAREKGDLLKSYIWSKKAVFLDSSNGTAQHFYNEISKQFQPPGISHQISNWQHFEKFVSRVPQDLFYITTLILLFGFFASITKNMLARRKNYVTGQYRPIKSWPSYVLFFFCAFMSGLSSFAYLNSQKKWALIQTEKTAVQSVYGENKPIIYEAPAGLQVEVLAKQDSYTQIRYSGAFSGWVQSANLEFLSLSFEHESAEQN